MTLALIAILAVAGLLGVAAAVLAVIWGVEDVDVWSIGIYVGGDWRALQPHPAHGAGPALTANDVTDCAAGFVADPFILRRGADWHMFFEVYERASRRGIISHATSLDGINWRYRHVVLRESFHLSYPHVFEADGEFYMIPECAESGGIRLYRAARFPDAWQFECQLVAGKYFDATVIFHNGRWWMWTMDACYSLHLFGAAELRGPWVAHPRSPVVQNCKRTGRPGGRMLHDRGKIVRFAQDGELYYGSRVRAVWIEQLDELSYVEREESGDALLTGSGSGWNASGMHHVDALRFDDHRWIAAVDGNRRRSVVNWRAGARRVQRTLGQWAKSAG